MAPFWSNAPRFRSKSQSDPYSGSSLVPMLIAGLVLTLIGMIAVVLLT